MLRPARQVPVAPRVDIVSLGCPKALVDSERILTRLRAEGYEISGSYDGAEVVLVNTCGFLDSAKTEGLAPGDLVPVLIEDADEYDLWAQALPRG